MSLNSQYQLFVSKERKILIAIADDYKVFREGIKKCISSDKAFKLILEAENGQELITGLEKAIPDVVIMDLNMPVMDGMEATQVIRKKFPGVKVLVITMYEHDEFIIHLMKIGANGYLLKNTEPDEIRRSIYAVYENGYYFHDLVNKTLLKKLVIENNIKPSFNQNIDFTEREHEVLRLIYEEKMVTEIAKEISLGSHSVEEIRQRLVEKVGVRNTAGLVMFAIKNGIVN